MAELTFKGFPPAAFEFYDTLADNNEKAWFEAHRETFETAVRQPLEALLEDAAEAFGGTVKLSRPHRDVRFSKDKSPYKRNLFGVVRGYTDPDGSAESASGLYASVSADGLFAGTGYYEMSADQLARYRAALDDPEKARALSEAIEGAKRMLDVRGRALKTAPKGYARDHPAIELLRMKELIVVRSFPAEKCHSARIKSRVFDAWRSAFPVVAWFDRHVGASELSPQERFGRGRRRGGGRSSAASDG